MTTRIAITTATLLALLASPLAALATTVDTQVSATTDVSVSGGASTTHAGGKLDVRLTTAKDRADKEIDRRVASLNKLAERIGSAKRLSSAEQASLTATINAQISDLTALKAKIAADTTTADLRADIGSITKGYRIYALILPQASIMAAGDRALTVAALMEEFGGKLSSRIASASSSASLGATLDDYNAKVADAKVQAQAAIDEVKDLQPDNGDQTVKDANLAALKAARAKIQAAHQDLVAARKDAETIVQAVGGGTFHASTNASTTTETH